MKKKHQLIQSEYSQIEKQKQLNFLIKDADLWLDKGSLHNAIFQYKKAVELFPENKILKYKLLELYKTRCISKQIDCDTYKEFKTNL